MPLMVLDKMNLQKTKLIIFCLALVCNFAIATISQAGVLDQITNGFSETGTQAGYNPQGEGKPPKEFIEAFGTYASGMALLMGLFFMILVIYSGYLWASARGNEEQVNKAKKILIQAAIGIGIVIAARIMAELAINVLIATLPISDGSSVAPTS